MPEIVTIPPSGRGSNTVEVELSKEGLTADSRVIYWDREGWYFECSIEGKTLTVTRIDEDFGNGSWSFELYFRIYDPTIENVPDFTSKLYTYHGLEYERAPHDVEEVVIDPSVTVIGFGAFLGCTMMMRCSMGDNVREIEREAFKNCEAMRHIKLSRSLQSIGFEAFHACESIGCLFLPQHLKKIDDAAFWFCLGLKILVLPANIDPHPDLDQLGDRIALFCIRLLTDANYQYEESDGPSPNNREVHQWLKDRNNHMPLLRLCADPHVTAVMIRDFIRHNGTEAFYQKTDGDNHLHQGLTPLHVLICYNGFVADDVIMACYDANPSALFTPDLEGMAPFDFLWADHSGRRLNVIVHLLKDMCLNRTKINIMN